MSWYNSTASTAAPSLPVGMRSSKAFYSAFRWGATGNLISVPFIAFEVANAQRGEVLPTAAGTVGGLMSYPVISGVLAAGLTLIPGVGPAAATVMASLLALYPSSRVEQNVTRGFRTLTDIGRNVRHLEFGGNYIDTASAQQERMNALQEMSGSFQTSRRYLGQEAAIMHR